jgi:hypothetical protein
MKSATHRGADLRPKSTKNLDGYGAPQIPWKRVRTVLDAGLTQAPTSGGPDRHTFWLSTVNDDGSPHAVSLGALRLGGAFYFTSGDGTRKSKNLARDPRCSLAVATMPFDLVIEGEAGKVTDKATLERVAKAYSAQGWKATVKGGALAAEYSAPSAGPAPWYVYEMVPKTVFAFATAEPSGAARWDF